MSALSRKKKSMEKVVRLRDQLKQQAQSQLRQTQHAMDTTEQALQQDWVACGQNYTAEQLWQKQFVRDAGYAHLQQLRQTQEAQHLQLLRTYQEFRQAQILLEDIRQKQKEQAQKRDLQTTDDWLRRSRKGS